MPQPPAPPQVIAMHGWSGLASNWDPWRQAFNARGWQWQSGERGYGAAAPHLPHWHEQGPRVLIAHSMGPHLLPTELLAAADAVVLLASFGRFVPAGAAGHRVRGALEAMATQLDDADSARSLLQAFLREAVAPEPEELVPPGAAAGPLGPEQRQRLRDDLEILGCTQGLPAGFPSGIPVLSVEAAQDRIVVPEARMQLRDDLETHGTDSHWLTFEQAGHCLLQPGLVAAVLQWLEPRVAP